MELITTAHLEAPDDFYEALIDCHRDLSNQQSHALNARLVLLLANHIGAQDVLQQALRAARDSSPSLALEALPGTDARLRAQRTRALGQTDP